MQLPRGITTVTNPKPITCPVVESFKQRKTLPKYDPSITLEELKEHWISSAVAHFRGNKSEAARALDVGKEAIYRRLCEKK